MGSEISDIKNNNKEYLTWIDIAKAFGIILVIWGHLPISSITFKIIYIFHLYLFFFLAGVLDKSNNTYQTKTVILRNLKRLYIPFLFFSIIWILFNLMMRGYQLLLSGGEMFTFKEAVAYIFKIAVTLLYGTDSIVGIHVGPTWFLIALLTVKILYYFFRKTFNNNIYLGIISIILYSIGFLLNGKNFLPFSIIPAMTGFIFYYLGTVSKQSINKLRKFNIPFKLLLSIIFIGISIMCSTYLEEPLLLFVNMLPANPMIVLIGAISGIISMVLISMIIEKFTLLINAISFIGKNSLIIMGIHSPLRLIMLFIFMFMGNVGQIYQNIIITLMTIFLSVPIILLFKKYLPILVGESKIDKRRMV